MIARRKLADGTTVYDVRVGNSSKSTFDRYDDAEEAEGKLRQARRRERAGLQTATKPNITYNALVKLWADNFDPSKWRVDMVSYSTARWGKVKVRDIQAEHVGAWISGLTGKTGKKLAEKTRAHVLETMRQVLNAGVEWGYLTVSPARPSRGFKAPAKRSRVRPIMPFESWDDVLRVADACAATRAVTGPLVRFACATGLRPIEWIDLRWSDVDFHARTIRVSSKTDAGHRTVPLSRHAVEALNELPRSLTGIVFTAKKGGPFDYKNWRKTDWRLALTSCGMEHRTPYEMRHTFATLALAHGAPIDDVATVMGHADISVAFNYYRKWIKVAADRLRATLDTIDTEDRANAQAQ